MRWFRRPAQSWKQLTFLKAGPPRPVRPPMPRRLVDVIGVGMSQTVAGVTIELLSIERYQEGHVVLFRLLRQQRLTGRSFVLPELRLTVIGESGATDALWPMGGSSGGGADGVIEFRQSYGIVPAPAPVDGQLVVEVSQIEWRRHLTSGEQEIAWTDDGPWRFVVKTAV